MELSEPLGIVNGFFADARVLTVLGMILLDVALAISEAIKTGTFDWKRLPEFYRSMVMPYVVGYAAAYGAAHIIVGEWAGGLPVEIIVSVLWAAIVGNLGASIIGHLQGLSLDVPK